MGKYRDNHINSSIFSNFTKIQGFLSAAEKSGQNIHFFGLAGVLVGFSKKVSKKAFFILEICTIWGLPKSMGHEIDEIRSKIDGFDGLFDGIWCPTYEPRKTIKIVEFA